MKTPNTKLQTTKKLQVPMNKSQGSPNSQAQMGRAAALWVGIWNLGFIWSLGIGHRKFANEDVDLRLTTAN